MTDEQTQPDSESPLNSPEQPQPQPEEAEETEVVPLLPDEEEMEPPIAAPASSEPLRDPRTGELLRDQNPGVPNGEWIGKHHIGGADSEKKEPTIPDSDFGKE